ncbi:hypothetical protein PCANC_22156 [Puccinia coronata f. sp. avenae]|uniref:Uncharacterized protein n=1 Tax=Puccinia coronata f. sp. avenae TaxID=200324 RepID=A0A2N5SIE8_9BASI|nr:hypothetical protein PCANC_22156 [Puccinia coronata f. sp. avenae]
MRIPNRYIVHLPVAEKSSSAGQYSLHLPVKDKSSSAGLCSLYPPAKEEHLAGTVCAGPPRTQEELTLVGWHNVPPFQAPDQHEGMIRKELCRIFVNNNPTAWAGGG